VVKKIKTIMVMIIIGIISWQCATKESPKPAITEQTKPAITEQAKIKQFNKYYRG